LQVYILNGGAFSLPDGTQARAGDYINVPKDTARKFAERGVANVVTAEPDAIKFVEGTARIRWAQGDGLRSRFIVDGPRLPSRSSVLRWFAPASAH
jgi:hypothetical protein